MANIKTSQLPEATQLEAADIIGFVSVGIDGLKTNKKITVNNFLNHVNSDITINSDNISGISFTINGSSGVNDLLMVETTNNRIGIKNSSPSELVHVQNGNIRIGGLGDPGDVGTGVFIQSKEKLEVPAIAGTSNLLMSTNISEITVASGSASTYQYVIGIGTEGQMKTIYVGASALGSFTVTLLPDTGNSVSILNVSAAGIKFTKLGGSVTLMAVSPTKWVVLGSNYAEFLEG